MGLDMYLSKRTYVWSDDRDKVKISGVKGIDNKKVKYIIEDAGYWRKANQIHNWFVQNVQGGEDDCKPYTVYRSDLEDLLKLVNQVLATVKLVKGDLHVGTNFKDGKVTKIMEHGMKVANPEEVAELLPCGEGFFFGSSEYDQYYVEDLKETKKIIEAALADEFADEFEYRSSW